MPIYTIGIVIFFLYTMMRIMFKKPEDSESQLKDFNLDAEQRKFIFAEDYCPGASGLIPDITAKDYALIQERLEQKRRSRSKTPEVYNKEDLEPILENVIKEEAVEEDVTEKTVTDTQIEAETPAETPAEAQAQAQAETDTSTLAGAGERSPEFSDTIDTKESDPTTVDQVQPVPSGVDQRTLLLAFAALKAQKDDEVDQLRRRLEETERAMERIVAQMGNVSEKLMPIISTDASAHPDKAMVEEAGGNQAAASKGSSPDMEEYEVIATELKNPTAEVGSEIHPEQDAHITSTTAESECKDST